MNNQPILAIVTLILVVGATVLAVIDPSTRATFNDLVKIVLGAYMGLLIPRQRS